MVVVVVVVLVVVVLEVVLEVVLDVVLDVVLVALEIVELDGSVGAAVVDCKAREARCARKKAARLEMAPAGAPPGESATACTGADRLMRQQAAAVAAISSVRFAVMRFLVLLLVCAIVCDVCFNVNFGFTLQKYHNIKHFLELFFSSTILIDLSSLSCATGATKQSGYVKYH